MWYDKGGLYGTEGSDNPGCIPVPKDSPMYEALINFEKALQTGSLEKQKEYLDIVMDIAAENVWSINITSNTPCLGIASKDLKNVPDKVVNASSYATPTNAGPETFYFENPINIAEADTMNQIMNTSPWPKYSGGGK